MTPSRTLIAHSLGESDDVTDSWQGPQNALLIILSLLK